MLFSSFPYDYPLLWTSSPTPAIFFDQLETHLKFMHASPSIIPRILHIAITIGFFGFFIKLYKPSEANLLFDGASLVLYVIATAVYITNIVKGLRIVTLGKWGEDMVPELHHQMGEGIVGREDSLRILAASNTILALVLVGVLVLQAGQWYAERKEKDETEKFEEEVKKEKKEAGAAKPAHATRGAAKKKQ
jgi:hypothetical protein